MVGVYSPTLSPWLAWTSYGLAYMLPSVYVWGFIGESRCCPFFALAIKGHNRQHIQN